jgi:hypothetical protein
MPAERVAALAFLLETTVSFSECYGEALLEVVRANPV